MQHQPQIEVSEVLSPAIKAAIFRRVVAITGIAIVGSLGISALVSFVVQGHLFEGAVGWVAAVLAPGLIAPCVSYMQIKTSHLLTLSNQRLRSLSETDALTNTYNRRRFVELAERELTLAQRHGYCTSIVIFDFDYFKQVNDRYGHLLGDKALVHVIDVIKTMVREADVLARFGGEEFILMLPHTSEPGAVSLVGRILKKVCASPLMLENEDNVVVTLSAGVVTCETSQTPLDTMLSCADSLLYDSKQNGRNRLSAETLTCTWPRRESA